MWGGSGGGRGMKNEGWTLGDLAGELWARGIDIEDILDRYTSEALDYPTAERAASEIARRDN